MIVKPRAGINRDNLLASLRAVHNEAVNLRGGSGRPHAYEHLLAYLGWASNAVRILSNQISSADLDRLVLTPGYERLLSGVGNMTDWGMETQRVVNGLVSLELDQRVDAFDAAIKALEGQIRRWSGYAHFVVPDTSFYIEHDEKLEDADLGPVIDVWESPIRILVPIITVDELDALKQSKDRHIRWRAGYTLAVLDRVFAKSTGPARLRAGDVVPGPDGKTRSELTIELLFDPPGHVRLPINDDEIVDRVLAVEPLAGRQITLLTYDTGQSMRARNGGLQALKLSKKADTPA